MMSACWEKVSAIVHGFLSTVCLEAPSRQSSDHVGSPSSFNNEKVLITAIKVATLPFFIHAKSSLN